MCQWFGDGGIWYLNPKNYAHRMYRKRAPGSGPTTQFLQSADEIRAAAEESAPLMERAHRLSEAKADGDMETFARLQRQINEQEAKAAGCQVVPLKDCFDLLDMVQGPLGAMMCICRKQLRGEEASRLEEYSCLGIGTGMLKWQRWPERYRGGVEFLTPAQTKEWLEYWDKRGYVHMVMQEGQDFIGGLCNCDYPGCLPIRLRLDYGLTTQLVKAEYVAKVDYSRCNGCGDCVKRCQFAALRYEVALDKANIDPFQCFGCAVCQGVCRRQAIKLYPRSAFPALANLW
ncbi:MAG: 4Fe-4S binding protein [Chloroflexota bacterium]|nr:4Fe-4S binding protein [Chloroflexota bacterium]